MVNLLLCLPIKVIFATDEWFAPARNLLKVQRRKITCVFFYAWIFQYLKFLCVEILMYLKFMSILIILMNTFRETV